ncbi:PfkB family carbohydrate kinase [Deinococcus malanensis]|uniref:PfkB family carbohydrate kinase n=1 Tax=Deinococcus malanensis TaxID=1706855 RepID=UPI00363FAD27
MSGVLCFGGAVMDFVNDGHDHWQVRAGGSAWNVARVLAALGLPTAFAGALSTDPFGERLLAEGAAQGLDLRHTPRVDAPTALSVVHRTHPAQYTFYADGAADSRFSGVAEETWTGVVAAYFGGITLVRDPARDAFLTPARAARARGCWWSTTRTFARNSRTPTRRSTRSTSLWRISSRCPRTTSWA